MEMTPSPMTLLLVTCSKTGDEGNSQGASLTKVLGPTTSQVIQSPQEIMATAAVSQPQQMIGVLNPDRTIALVTSLSQPQATNVHVIDNVATALKSLSTIAPAQKVTNCQVFSQGAQMVSGSSGNITYNATPAQQIHSTRIDDKKAICIPAELPQTFQLVNKHIFTPTGQIFLQPQGFQVPTSVQNGGQALLHGMTQIGVQNITIKQGNVVQTLKSPMPVQQTFPMQVPISSANGCTVLQTVHVPVQPIQGVPRTSIPQSQGRPLTVNMPAHMVPQLSNMGHIAQEMTPSPMTLLLVTCSKTGDEGNSQGASLTKVLGPTTSQVIQSPQEIMATAAVSQPQQMIGVLNPDRTIALVTSLSQPQATNVHVIDNVATALKSLSTIAPAQKVTNCQVFSQGAQMVSGSSGNITYNATPAQQIHSTRIDDKKAICIPAELPQTFQLVNKHIFTPTGQIFLQPQGFQVPTSVQNGGQALLHGMTQIGVQNITIKQGNVVQTLKSPMPVQQTFPMQVPISSANGCTVLQTVHVPVQPIQGVPRTSIPQSQGRPLTVNMPAHMVPQLSNMGHIAQADNHVSKLPIPKRLHKPHKPYMRYRLKVKEQNDDVLDINSLPNEIMLKIFAFLKHNQLGQIARVCRRWNVLTRSPILWKKVEVEFSSSSHESQTNIAKSFVNRLPPCVSHLTLNFGFGGDWIESLYFGKLCLMLKKKCPHLEMLKLYNASLSDTLLTVIDLCIRHLQNIQALVFYFCDSPIGPARRKYSDISNLELLHIDWCDFGSFNKLPFSRMPNLKRLVLWGKDINDFWFENETSFFNQLHILDIGHARVSSRTFQIIQNHALNLKELYFCFTDLKDDDLSLDNSVFRNLKTICLVFCRGVTSNGVVSLIQSCQSLENVYVDEEVAASYAVHPSVVIDRCMLEIVKVREIFHSHNF